MKNRRYSKLIVISIVLACISMPRIVQATGYSVRKSWEGGYNNDSYENLMDNITMDFGEGMEYLGRSAVISAVTAGCAYGASTYLTSAYGSVAAAPWYASAAAYGGASALSGGFNAAMNDSDVGKGMLIGGISGGISGGVGAQGWSGASGAAYGAGIGGLAGYGAGLLLDKDYAWLYGLQGAISGAMAGYQAGPTRDAGSDTSTDSSSLWKDLTKSQFFREFAQGYTNRVMLGLTSEVVTSQVYVDTLHYDENKEEWDWDKDKAELYNYVATGLVGGLINSAAVLGDKDIMSQAAEQGTGEVLLTMAKGAFVGGVGGLAGGLLVDVAKRKMDLYDMDDDERELKEKEIGWEYLEPVVYQIGALAGTGLGKAVIDKNTYRPSLGPHEEQEREALIFPDGENIACDWETARNYYVGDNPANPLEVETKITGRKPDGSPELAYAVGTYVPVDLSSYVVAKTNHGLRYVNRNTPKEILTPEEFKDRFSAEDGWGVAPAVEVYEGDEFAPRTTTEVMQVFQRPQDFTLGEKRGRFVELYSTRRASGTRIALNISSSPFKELASEWPSLAGNAAGAFAKRELMRKVDDMGQISLQDYERHKSYALNLGKGVGELTSSLTWGAAEATGLIYRTDVEDIAREEHLIKQAKEKKVAQYHNKVADSLQQNGENIACDWETTGESFYIRDPANPQFATDLTLKKKRDILDKKTKAYSQDLEKDINELRSQGKSYTEILKDPLTLDTSEGALIWDGLAGELKRTLLSQVASAVNVELYSALKYDAGLNDLNSAYTANLITSLPRAIAYWHFTNKAADSLTEYFPGKGREEVRPPKFGEALFITTGSSQIGALKEALKFGYREKDYTSLQWVNYLSDARSIAAPLAYPTRIRYTESEKREKHLTGEYRTDGYLTNSLTSASTSNIRSTFASSSTLARFFGVRPERLVFITEEYTAERKRSLNSLPDEQLERRRKALEKENKEVSLTLQQTREELKQQIEGEEGWWIFFDDPGRKLGRTRPWDYRGPMPAGRYRREPLEGFDVYNNKAFDPELESKEKKGAPIPEPVTGQLGDWEVVPLPWPELKEEEEKQPVAWETKDKEPFDYEEYAVLPSVEPKTYFDPELTETAPTSTPVKPDESTIPANIHAQVEEIKQQLMREAKVDEIRQELIRDEVDEIRRELQEQEGVESLTTSPTSQVFRSMPQIDGSRYSNISYRSLTPEEKRLFSDVDVEKPEDTGVGAYLDFRGLKKDSDMNVFSSPQYEPVVEAKLLNVPHNVPPETIAGDQTPQLEPETLASTTIPSAGKLESPGPVVKSEKESMLGRHRPEPSDGRDADYHSFSPVLGETTTPIPSQKAFEAAADAVQASIKPGNWKERIGEFFNKEDKATPEQIKEFNLPGGPQNQPEQTDINEANFLQSLKDINALIIGTFKLTEPKPTDGGVAPVASTYLSILKKTHPDAEIKYIAPGEAEDMGSYEVITKDKTTLYYKVDDKGLKLTEAMIELPGGDGVHLLPDYATYFGFSKKDKTGETIGGPLHTDGSGQMYVVYGDNQKFILPEKEQRNIEDVKNGIREAWKVNGVKDYLQGTLPLKVKP